MITLPISNTHCINIFIFLVFRSSKLTLDHFSGPDLPNPGKGSDPSWPEGWNPTTLGSIPAPADFFLKTNSNSKNQIQASTITLLLIVGLLKVKNLNDFSH